MNVLDAAQYEYFTGPTDLVITEDVTAEKDFILDIHSDKEVQLTLHFQREGQKDWLPFPYWSGKSGHLEFRTDCLASIEVHTAKTARVALKCQSKTLTAENQNWRSVELVAPAETEMALIRMIRQNVMERLGEDPELYDDGEEMPWDEDDILEDGTDEFGPGAMETGEEPEYAPEIPMDESEADPRGTDSGDRTEDEKSRGVGDEIPNERPLAASPDTQEQE